MYFVQNESIQISQPLKRVSSRKGDMCLRNLFILCCLKFLYTVAVILCLYFSCEINRVSSSSVYARAEVVKSHYKGIQGKTGTFQKDNLGN